jgi:hypothetical protein
MLDLDAPIIPGVSAAGFHIDQFIERSVPIGTPLIREQVHSPIVRSPGTVRYRSESVDLWVANSVIQQIGVHAAYHGKLLDHIMLGMTMEDIERLVGRCIEDDEDELAIYGVEGLCFDVLWHPNYSTPVIDFSLPHLRFSPIAWFFVFQPQ